MILESVINLIILLIKSLFGWIELPSIPTSVSSVIDTIFQYMESGISLIGIFLPLDFILEVFPFVLAIINFDYIYRLTMWVIRKLPFSVE